MKVEPIEFEPVTLERLGCIPTRSIGTRNRLFYLKNLSHRHVVKLNCLKSDSKTYFVSQFPKSMALMLRRGNAVWARQRHRFKLAGDDLCNTYDAMMVNWRELKSVRDDGN